ncbi:hypothetical protein BGZ46_006447 [Entomortierella lignicola]|nr:hypothetical protein BGZ46_006447 [Entomortierella lignicola]
MVSFSLRSLIVSATFAASIVLSTAAPVPQDACGALGALNETNITFDDVAACYNAVPFDSTTASSILQSVYTIFADYYIFRDSALTPDLQAPFTSPPVDILEKLQTIGKTKYTNDISFHTDISNVLSSLHDAHVSYNIDCYGTYFFLQRLNLYAPVINGQQSLRVLHDFGGRGLEDCEVLTIEGKPGLAFIQEFTDSVSLSKDAGVRQNHALASEVFSATSGDFILTAGAFSERNALPEKSSVEYVLQCSNSSSTVTVTDPWRVVASTPANFNSVKSYVNNVCKTPPSTTGSTQKRALSDSKQKSLLPTIRKSVLYDDAASTPPKPSANSTSIVESLGFGNATAFYHLKQQPDTGIVVVFTFEVDDENSELDTVVNALQEFQKRNVTKIIFDFQGNTGGSVDFASTLIQLFFPNKGQFDKVLPSNVRVDKSIQVLTQKVFKNPDAGLYDASTYIDFETKAQYTNDALFLTPVTLTRNGRSALYTELTGLATSVLNITDTVSGFPWTNNPNNIRILSDGRCGSSCALATHYLHSLYNVSTYAIGGVQGKELSFFSFAGGSVSSLSAVVKVYELGNVTAPLDPLLYAGDVSFPLLEVFSAGSEVPLEYDYPLYSADHHIDFDSSNARSRGVMWTQVATDAWN